MMYLGDFPADQAIYFAWNTNDGDGASITRSGDGTISVYKDASNGTAFDVTQVTTGVTNDEDFDALVGVHTCSITTTDAWYETGHDYIVVLGASTIDTQTVNAVIAHFSIENRHMVGTDSAYTGTPPTAVAIRQEIDSNSTRLDADISSRSSHDAAAVKTAIEAAGSKLTLTLEDTADLQANQGAWATAVGFSTHSAANVWAVGTRALTDKAGFSLSTAGIKAIWDQLTNVLTTAGSIGKLLVDNINATISSRNATTPPTVGEIRTEMEGAGTKLTLTLEDTGTTIPGTITALQTDMTALDVLTEGGGAGDLAAIKTQVDAILDLERESGVVSVTDAETTLYEDAAPTKNKMGVVVKIDMAALASGDTFVVKEKYKDENGGAYQEVDSVSYTGAQTKPLRIIALTPYRYGAIITMQRTAGTNRSIEWESFVEE